MTVNRPEVEISTAEILSRSLSLYVAEFAHYFLPFLAANMIIVVGARLVSSVMPPVVIPNDITEVITSSAVNSISVVLGLTAILLVLIWVVTTVVSGIAVKYSADLFEKGHARLGEAATFAFKKISFLVSVGLIVGVLAVLGLIFFIVPGILVMMIFSISIQVTMIENQSVLRSLQRSRGMVAHRWMKTLTLLLLLGLVIVLGTLTGTVIGNLVSYPLLSEAIAIVIGSLAQPLLPISLTYFYYSLLIREKTLKQTIVIQSMENVDYRPRFCYLCGQRLPPDAIFCPQCGKQME